MKRIAILPLLFFICNFNCSGTVKNNPQIRVLSYNIHHAEGMDQQLDLERIARVITSVAPDIVSLQEVDNQTGRVNGSDQAQELARLTGMRAFFGSSMPFDGGQYGNAILTNLTVESVQTLPLPGEPRSVLCAALKKTLADSTEIRFTFMATHLDTKAEPRLASVPLIENYFSADSAKPAIIAGDLNAIPGSPTMQAFQKSWHNATSSDTTLYTYPVVIPERQIDYILYRPENQWRVLETRVLEETVASDHRPILAVLEWQL